VAFRLTVVGCASFKMGLSLGRQQGNVYSRTAVSHRPEYPSFPVVNRGDSSHGHILTSF